MARPSPRNATLSRHAVTVWGQGERTLLLAHGFGCDQTAWRQVAPAFEPHYRLVSFDHIGAGRSDFNAYDPSRHASLQGYADDLVAIAQAMDLRDAVLVGHSASATAGALACLAAPSCFSHLVMIGASPRYLNDPATDYVGGFERADIDEMLDLMEKNFGVWANALVPMALNNPDQPAAQAELLNSFGRMDPSIARRWARAIFLSDLREPLRRVTQPTLALQCTDDAIAPVTVGQVIARTIPNCTLHLLRATGHFPHVSHPQEVIAALSQWLANQGL